ncbi:MAG: hypothetical protein C0467_14555 [Planctomycetaceae bacterium]|nr:hypothetical protein [Planctomycetaceae bacterium]
MIVGTPGYARGSVPPGVLPTSAKIPWNGTVWQSSAGGRSMPRSPSAWYRTSRGMWVGLIAGKLQSLGITDPNAKEAAEAVFLQLLAALSTTTLKPAAFGSLPAPAVIQPTTPISAPRTVSEAALEFLEKRKPKISPECWRQYDITLRVHFLPVFGSRLISSLTAEEIEDWADRRTWSSSTQNNNIGTVQTFLRWAKNPLSVNRPPKESRGAESVLSDEQFAKVVEAASRGDYGSDLVAFLKLLRETGARPQEIARLTVESTDWVNSCLRTKVHKGRRHGSERVVHFNTAAMEILTTQREKYGAGHLFRTCRGNPWRGPAIVKRMIQVSKRAGVHATAYMGRHSFATAALVAGIPDAVVAELLGHRGTAMVAKHYGHIAGQSRVLKDAVEKVNKPKAG